MALYYYTGKNIAPETTRRTTIKITATSGRNSKTYTIELGADSPNVENRNYSIYRNNNYTFNINLKLYTMEILEILSRESENTQHVYVYEENGRWYAYERSAQLVKYLLAELVKIKQFVNTTYDIILDRV